VLLGDKEFGAGGEAVGVGEIITVGGDDFTPLTRGTIVFGGDGRKSIALLDDMNSWGLLAVRDSWLVARDRRDSWLVARSTRIRWCG
jgi:hypothetical protein